MDKIIENPLLVVGISAYVFFCRFQSHADEFSSGCASNILLKAQNCTRRTCLTNCFVCAHVTLSVPYFSRHCAWCFSFLFFRLFFFFVLHRVPLLVNQLLNAFIHCSWLGATTCKLCVHRWQQPETENYSNATLPFVRTDTEQKSFLCFPRYSVKWRKCCYAHWNIFCSFSLLFL